MSQYSHLSNMDPQLAEAVAKLPRPPAVIDLDVARKQMNDSIPYLKAILEPQLPEGVKYVS